MAALPSQIPLFPLPNAVLFPQMPLPLHVFEPRYRQMVTEVMEAHKTIGITLLQPGWETAYEGRPSVYPVGCAGLVDHCETLEHGRFDIVLRGLSRFRILEEHPGRPYRLATIEPLEDELGDPDALEAARKRVMAAIGQAEDGPSVLVLQTDLPHGVFVNALSQSLPLSPLERQSLLACNSILARCARLLELLEFRRLEQTWGGSNSEKVH